ncbi:MAG: hypothetical protein K8953_12805, partial [Proteobacteria bacterium]|nr:hypothetical protein [Pseudomonadota bacterium]
FNDGNIYDGIAYLRGTHKRAYAGVLSGTSLGAPVTGTAETTARWAGLFRSTWHITSPTSFALIVGFAAGGGGTLDALVESSFGGDRRAGIDGAFDAGGIITGEVIYGEPKAGGCLTNRLLTVTESCFKDANAASSLPKNTATLTGLIGEQGAVAAFTGEIYVFPGNRGWAGGFVATPDFCANRPTDPFCIVNAADLVDYFGNDVPPATIAATATGDNIFGGFLNLATDETTIAAGGLTTMTETAIGGGTATPAAAVQFNRPGSGNLGNQFIDGVIYINGFNGDNNQAFVGIRPSTNLGRPLLEQPSTAAWDGRYYDSTHVSDSNVITFNIDFNEGDINT